MVYNTNMPVTAKNKKVREEGQEKNALVVNFTNGALEQINELKKYFNAPSELEIVKLGISILQDIKEDKEKKEQENKNAKK